MADYEEGETTVEIVESSTTDDAAVTACAGETATVTHVDDDADDTVLGLVFDGLYNPVTEEPLELSIEEQYVVRV